MKPSHPSVPWFAVPAASACSAPPPQFRAAIAGFYYAVWSKVFFNWNIAKNPIHGRIGVF
jgi:hypothetical protein